MHISSLILQSCCLRGNVCVCTVFAQPACDEVITLLLWLRIISRNHVQTHAPLLFFFFNASGLLLLWHKRPLGLKNKRDLIPELRAAVVSLPSEWISDTIRKYFAELQRKHFSFTNANGHCKLKICLMETLWLRKKTHISQKKFLQSHAVAFQSLRKRNILQNCKRNHFITLLQISRRPTKSRMQWSGMSGWRRRYF